MSEPSNGITRRPSLDSSSSVPRQKKTGFRGKLFLVWLLATTVGTALGFVAASLLPESSELISSLAFSALLGLAIGIPQALVLSLPLEARIAWVAINSMGWPLGYAVIGRGLMFVVTFIMLAQEELPGQLAHEPYFVFATAGMLIAGPLIVGVAEQILLTRHFHPTWHWIWLSLIGWGLAWAGMWVRGGLELFPSSAIVEGTINGALLGFVVGLFTGWALARMRPISPSDRGSR